MPDPLSAGFTAPGTGQVVVDTLRRHGWSDNAIRGVLFQLRNPQGSWGHYATWLRGRDWSNPGYQTMRLAQNIYRRHPHLHARLIDPQVSPQDAASAFESQYIQPNLQQPDQQPPDQQPSGQPQQQPSQQQPSQPQSPDGVQATSVAPSSDEPLPDDPVPDNNTAPDLPPGFPEVPDGGGSSKTKAPVDARPSPGPSGPPPTPADKPEALSASAQPTQDQQAPDQQASGAAPTPPLPPWLQALAGSGDAQPTMPDTPAPQPLAFGQATGNLGRGSTAAPFTVPPTPGGGTPSAGGGFPSAGAQGGGDPQWRMPPPEQGRPRPVNPLQGLISDGTLMQYVQTLLLMGSIGPGTARRAATQALNQVSALIKGQATQYQTTLREWQREHDKVVKDNQDTAKEYAAIMDDPKTSLSEKQQEISLRATMRHDEIAMTMISDPHKLDELNREREDKARQLIELRDAISRRVQPKEGDSVLSEASIDELAREMAAGGSRPTGIGAADMRRVENRYAELLQQEGISSEEILRRRAQRKDDSSEERLILRGKIQTYNAQIRPLATGINNLQSSIPRNLGDVDQLIELGLKQSPTGSPVIDRWIRAGRRSIEGDPDVSAFDFQLRAVRADIGAILAQVGQTGRIPVNSQREAAELLPEGITSAQLRGARRVLARDYQRRIDSLIGQYNQVIDRFNEEVPSQNARPMPDFKVDEGPGPEPASAQRNTGRFTPPSDWQYSPSRRQYRDPQGRIYDRQGTPVDASAR